MANDRLSNSEPAPVLVGVVMGSSSDWEIMRHAVDHLEKLGIPHEARVVSAHRTPDLLYEYAEGAAARAGTRPAQTGVGIVPDLPGAIIPAITPMSPPDVAGELRPPPRPTAGDAAGNASENASGDAP